MTETWTSSRVKLPMGRAACRRCTSTATSSVRRRTGPASGSIGGGKGQANTSAIGAVVRVTAGGKTQTQYVSGGYGHGNVQADLVLTFGLGATCDIDKVEVRWPDSKGTVSTYTDVLANYEVTIKQGAAMVAYPK